MVLTHLRGVLYHIALMSMFHIAFLFYTNCFCNRALLKEKSYQSVKTDGQMRSGGCWVHETYAKNNLRLPFPIGMLLVEMGRRCTHAGVRRQEPMLLMLHLPATLTPKFSLGRLARRP